MRKPHGNFLYIDPDPASWQDGVVEMDSYTCMHCSAWKRVAPGKAPTDEYIDPMTGRKEQGFVCKCCNDNEYICRSCKATGICMPIAMACEIIEKPIRQLDATIKRDEEKRRFLRDVFGIT
jgi:hypothetical protein